MRKVRDFISDIFTDRGFEEVETSLLEHAAISDLFPYRIFDPETLLYFNDKTTGFIIEASPQVATDEITANLFTAITSSMPANGGIQIINWSSPNISKTLNAWASSRIAGGDLVETLTASRIKHLNEKKYGSDSNIKSVPLNRRIFICGWIEGETSLSNLEILKTFRKGIVTAIGGNNVEAVTLRPLALLELLQEMLHSEQHSEHANVSYSNELPLNHQLPDTSIKVSPDYLEFAGKPKLSVNVGSVSKFPSEWNDALGILLYGDPDRLDDCPHAPVLTVLNAVAIPKGKSQGDLLKQLVIMDRSKKMGMSKFITDFAGKETEISNLSQELEASERLFKCSMVVISYAQGGEEGAKAAGYEMEKIYRKCGFTLRHEKYLQLPMLLSALPLGMTAKHIETYGKLSRMRLLKGRSVASLAPIHGEFTGNSQGSGMLLVGRQGEVFNWDNYISEGNYNISVVGKSGAGKSVFMQELIFSIYANGGKALVIDDGYSFKTTCDILDGVHIAFDGSVDLKLNPFTMLEESMMEDITYRTEATVLISMVVASMVSLGDQKEGRVEGLEEQYIANAINSVWDTKRAKGEITDVYDLLLEEAKKEPRLKDVCHKLKTFCREGVYGNYFTGASNVTVDQPFTVVELSDLKNQPDLEQVVLQIIMFLGTELMFKTDRSVPVAILIDEAWDMLKGQGTAKFIEGVARRARKYTGALITGTQSIDDYYANQAAEVCYQNSDWLVMLAQKPETIDRLEQDKKLSLQAGFANRLKSLTSVSGQFSEMAIKGQNGWFFGRLLLDPFSLAVFSSKGSTVENLRKRKQSGMTTVEALKDMVDKGEVN